MHLPAINEDQELTTLETFLKGMEDEVSEAVKDETGVKEKKSFENEAIQIIARTIQENIKGVICITLEKQTFLKKQIEVDALQIQSNIRAGHQLNSHNILVEKCKEIANGLIRFIIEKRGYCKQCLNKECDERTIYES